MQRWAARRSTGSVRTRTTPAFGTDRGSHRRLRALQRPHRHARFSSVCSARERQWHTPLRQGGVHCQRTDSGHTDCPGPRPLWRAVDDADDHAFSRPVQHDDLCAGRPLSRRLRATARGLHPCGGPGNAGPAATATGSTRPTVWHDDVERRADGFRLVAYDIPRGCIAAYYPETNPLVPLDSVGDVCNTPTSKSILVLLHPTASPPRRRRCHAI